MADGGSDGASGSAGDPPQFVAVRCGDKSGTFQVADKTVECDCAECDRPGMMPWNVIFWERHCGRGACKKWRDSVKVSSEAGGGTLGKWLASFQGRDQGGDSGGTAAGEGKAAAVKKEAAPEEEPANSAPRTAEADSSATAKPGKSKAKAAPEEEPANSAPRTAEATSSAIAKPGKSKAKAEPATSAPAVAEADSAAAAAPGKHNVKAEPGEAATTPPAVEAKSGAAGKFGKSKVKAAPAEESAASLEAATVAKPGKGKGRGKGRGRGKLKQEEAPADSKEEPECAGDAQEVKGKEADIGLEDPEANDLGPNAALMEYLATIKGREVHAAATGRQFATQRCYSVVKKARSPLNVDHIKLLRGFGEGLVTKRIVGHFAKREFRRLLPPGMPVETAGEEKKGGKSPKGPAPAPGAEDLRGEVEAAVDAALESAELGDRGKLNTGMKNGLKRIREGLVVFLSLTDVRDLALLRSCTAEFLAYFKAALKAARKSGVKAKRPARPSEDGPRDAARAAAAPKRRRSTAASEAGSTPKPKKRRMSGGLADAAKAPTFSLDALQTTAGSPPPANPESVLVTPEPKRKLRPCKPFSGGWAIMVGLHLAGRPLKKMELVELSAARGLCREPLVKLQRTVGRGGQWYDAWSSCSRLRRIGWVSRVGGFKYALTAAGRIEAARYAEECERVRGQSCAAGALAGDMPQSPNRGCAGVEAGAKVEAKEEVLEDETVGASLLATQVDFGASQLDFPCSQLEPSASQLDTSASQADIPASQGPCRRRIRQKRVEDVEEVIGKAKAEAESGVWSVLVDTAEKPVIREALGKLLTEAAELRLPGVDYAFGRKTSDGEWALADIVVERKTCEDFHNTLTSRRAELQARIHASLRGAGFRVAMVLEGVQDLRQHPLMGELLKHAYASRVDVLTTANLRDTAELLTGLVSAANEHQGWTVGALRALLGPIYEPDPADLSRLALRALGIEKPAADALSKSYGSLSALLHRLPRPDGDMEAAVERVACAAGLTPYQTGKAFRSMGLENAPLSRKRGLVRQGSGPQAPKEKRRPGKRWRRGLLMRDADAVVEVGPGLSSVFLGSLRVRLRVQEMRSLGTGMLRVCRGRRSYLYCVGSRTTNLEPGKHWLILPREADWRAATFFAARAYACHAIVSSLCASPEQAARHVAACAAALGKMDTPVSETRAAWGKRENGLAGVISLVRTDVGNMGSFMPAEVATTLARRLRLMADCTSLAQLLQKLREEGYEFLMKLGVPDFGDRRAAAIKTFLLGE